MLPNSVSYCRAKPSKVLAAAPRPREKGRFRVAISDRPPSPPWDLRLRTHPVFHTSQLNLSRSRAMRSSRTGAVRALTTRCWLTTPGRGGGRCERHTALQGSTTRTLSHMHSFHPHFIPELCFLLVALYYFPHVLLFHRRSLMDLLLAIQLRILFNSGTSAVHGMPHVKSRPH